MGRPEECASLLRMGKSPSEISNELGISTSSVIQYLFVAMGQRKIRLADMLMAIPADHRAILDETVEKVGTDYWFKVNGYLMNEGTHINREELQLYLWNRAALVGEMYVFLSDLELLLHERVARCLKATFPEAQSEWWTEGVPEHIRALCQSRHDKDPAPSGEPYQYTDFGHIKAILARNWQTLSAWLPPSEASQQDVLLQDLETANRIRNRVMHPVHRYTPSQQELDFIRGLSARLALDKWPSPPTASAKPGNA